MWSVNSDNWEVNMPPADKQQYPVFILYSPWLWGIPSPPFFAPSHSSLLSVPLEARPPIAARRSEESISFCVYCPLFKRKFPWYVCNKLLIQKWFRAHKFAAVWEFQFFLGGGQETPSYLTSSKSRPVLPFWYRLTQVVLEKKPINGCSEVVLLAFSSMIGDAITVDFIV